MDRLPKDLFPVEMQKAAGIHLGCPNLAATLLEIPSAAEFSIGISTSFHQEAAFLHPNEQSRFESYRLTKRRAEFLTGRICAKLAIMRLSTSLNLGSDLPLDEIEIANDANGRPFINGPAPGTPLIPEISISHGDRYAAALAAETPCGIDIQSQRENLLRVREKYCCPSELSILNTMLTNLPSLSCLALLWTAKEAAKKALSSLQMPGFLELKLIQVANDTPNYSLFTMAVMVQNSPRMPHSVKVLATTFTDYGLALCVLPAH